MEAKDNNNLIVVIFATGERIQVVYHIFVCKVLDHKV